MLQSIGLAPGGSGPQYSTGSRPLWESAVFRDLVIQGSYSGGKAETKHEKLTLEAYLESFSLVAAQLGTLNSSAAGGPMKNAVARVHAAFVRAIEVSRYMVKVSDNAGFFEVLTTFVASVKGLSPGQTMVVPAGFKGGVLTYVLNCDTYDSFTLAVCSTQHGLEYHPVRLDDKTGAVMYHSPMLITNIPVRPRRRPSHSPGRAPSRAPSRAPAPHTPRPPHPAPRRLRARRRTASRTARSGSSCCAPRSSRTRRARPSPSSTRSCCRTSTTGRCSPTSTAAASSPARRPRRRPPTTARWARWGFPARWAGSTPA